METKKLMLSLAGCLLSVALVFGQLDSVEPKGPTCQFE